MADFGGESGEIHFTIPFLPPSVNSIYQIIFSQRRVELKPDVRQFKTRCKEYIPRFNPNGKFVNCDFTFSYPHYYKNGNLRKFDTQNLMKVLCDAIAEKGGWDDSLIKSGSWKSIHSESKEQVEVEVRCE